MFFLYFIDFFYLTVSCTYIMCSDCFLPPPAHPHPLLSCSFPFWQAFIPTSFLSRNMTLGVHFVIFSLTKAVSVTVGFELPISTWLSWLSTIIISVTNLYFAIVGGKCIGSGQWDKYFCEMLPFSWAMFSNMSVQTFSLVFLLDCVFSWMWFKNSHTTNLIFSVPTLADGNVSGLDLAADSLKVLPLERSTSLFT